MPIGKGRYGELGNWGKTRRSIPKKRMVLVLALLTIGLIFAVSKNTVIPSVFADYNSSFSHTRTPIFVDSSLSGATFTNQITFISAVTCSVNDGSGNPCTTPAMAVSAGDTVVAVQAATGSACTSITDNQGNTLTSQVCIVTSGTTPVSIRTHAYSSPVASLTITCAGGNAGNEVCIAADYSGISSFGQSAGNGGSGTSVTFSLTTSSGSSIITGAGLAQPLGAYSPSESVRSSTVISSFVGALADILSAQTAGSHSLTVNSAGGFTQSFAGVEAIPIVSSPNFTNSRWLYNSTCVINFSHSFNFTYSTGVKGSDGKNCNSADMIISRSPINLQAVSGKMLEMEEGIGTSLASQSATASLRIDLILRTNGTLPGFMENYDGFNDTQARMIWSTCWTNGIFSGQVRDSMCSSTGISQGIFIAHDQSRTIKQEGFANDIVIQGNAVGVYFPEQQAVLNFTGPTNFINSEIGGASFSNNSTLSASQLQFGQDYYILIKASFNTVDVSPAANFYQSFYAGVAQDSLPQPFAIYSVPSSCADPVNKATCGLPTPQPVFQFNPLDPSSWGNAIIKGLLWVFTVAVPQGLVVMAGVLITEIKLVGNFIGGFFGQGNLGDNIANFLSGIGSLLLQAGTAITWIANLALSSLSIVSILSSIFGPYTSGLGNFLHDASVSVSPWLALLGAVGIWFPSSYMIILITFYFLLVFMNGLKGFFDWLHLVKWSSFALMDLFLIVLKAFIDGITWVLGRFSVISPGHKLTKFPHVSPGPLPKIDLAVRDMALFHDPTAWFLSVVGFFFTILWAATSSAGLPASTGSILNTLQPLTLAFFGISFMVLILVIPGWLLGKMMESGMISEKDL